MLELRKLRKVFHPGSINQVTAIDGLSCTVRRRDFITVIGSNGAGKSTLLNLIAGTLMPDAGQVLLAGQDITRHPEHRRAAFMGRVFQDPMSGTSAAMSIEENFALAARRGLRPGLRRGVRREDREAFREQLRRLGLGLEYRLQDKVGLLSGGQRQSLTLLMATLRQPKLLLLDEHTAALDPRTADQVLALTRDLIEQFELTAIMVTHNMRHALALGNRLLMMHQGRIILDLDGAEKADLAVPDLLAKFAELKGAEVADDKMLLI